MEDFLIIIPTLLIGVHGHGNMVWPYNWMDTDGNVGMLPGGHCAAYGGIEIATGNCMWFTNFTFHNGPATLPDEMRTYQNPGWPGGVDYYYNNPWRAPGAAPVFSACGVAGGNPEGCPVGDPTERDCPGGGFSYGPRAEDLDFPGVVTTEWTRGDTAEVGWGIMANHGGGYSYRLCPSWEEPTEECFQRTVLDFAEDTQWVQYGEGGEKVEFIANRTRIGTTPPGSQWTRNPIPACIEPDGGYFNAEDDCPNGTQFPPPAPGLQGYGETYLAPGRATFKWTLMDRVLVPSDLVPGDYVLSFRWDCEQTPQIWNACAQIWVL